jgi:hypothetical protein
MSIQTKEDLYDTIDSIMSDLSNLKDFREREILVSTEEFKLLRDNGIANNNR